VISAALFCALDGEAEGGVQPRDEASVNRGSGGGVVFTNRAVARVRHEECTASQRETGGPT
jgi:hypothetical protein